MALVGVVGLAWRSLKQRKLSSVLTGISIALGVALTVSVMALRTGAQSSYHDTARGYDVILGPTHGSPLQIVLNTMFHVGNAGGTVPWEAYETAKIDPQVKYAVPYAVGDQFLGHQVVGTSTDLFKVLTDAEGVPLGEGIRGTLFQDAKEREAVVGSIVAARTGLLRGTRFQVSHGGGTEVHKEKWRVVGMLRPTGTPADRAIFIPIEAFYEIEGHEKGGEKIRELLDRHARELAEAKKKAGKPDGSTAPDGSGDHAGDHDVEGEEHEHGTKEELGLSAIGIRLKSPTLRGQYVSTIRAERGPVQAVMPQDQVRELFEIISPIGRLLTWIVVLMIAVAGVGTMVSLYNTIQGRRREIAILRAVGARPHHVFAIIVTEALLLCLLGGVAGLLLGHASLVLVAPYLLDEAGVFLPAGFGLLDLVVIGILVAFGLLIGLLPAWRGLRTPVAANLHPTD